MEVYARGLAIESIGRVEEKAANERDVKALLPKKAKLLLLDDRTELMSSSDGILLTTRTPPCEVQLVYRFYTVTK